MQDNFSNEQLLKLAREGGNLDAYDLLFEKTYKLTGFVAGKYLFTGESFDDLSSVCSIALVKAYKTFKLEEGVLFSTYSIRCMHNEVLKYLKKYRRWCKECKLDDPVYVDYMGNEVTVLDSLPQGELLVLDDIINKEDIKLIKGIIDNLSEKERYVIHKLFYENKTQKTVGNELNMTQVNVGRIKKKVLTKIKILYLKKSA